MPHVRWLADQRARCGLPGLPGIGRSFSMSLTCITPELFVCAFGYYSSSQSVTIVGAFIQCEGCEPSGGFRQQRFSFFQLFGVFVAGCLCAAKAAASGVFARHCLVKG